MSFGSMPLGNGFRHNDDKSEEFCYLMETAVCSECSTFQLVDQPSPNQMFHGEYAFFSGTSERMKQHFLEFYNQVKKEISQTDPFVIEIGCNDGILIKHFAKNGIQHLGIDPSANVVKRAKENGINTIESFFSTKTANHILEKYRKSDVILAANVICHIPTINDIALGISHLLSKNGIFVFEEPYLGDVLEKITYDQIYDEHTFLFSVHSISEIFKRAGLEIFRVEHQWTHGGSMRYWLSHKGSRSIEESVGYFLNKEDQLAMNKIETYKTFKKSCENHKYKFLDLLQNIRKEGKRIVGYGATSKSTTILNYCGIGNDLIEFIADTTPIKHGKVTPGTAIPIRPHKEFSMDYPDYAILFAYNHATEIMNKEEDFIKSGGKWITYVPEVQIL